MTFFNYWTTFYILNFFGMIFEFQKLFFSVNKECLKNNNYALRYAIKKDFQNPNS